MIVEKSLNFFIHLNKLMYMNYHQNHCITINIYITVIEPCIFQTDLFSRHTRFLGRKELRFLI